MWRIDSKSIGKQSIKTGLMEGRKYLRTKKKASKLKNSSSIYVKNTHRINGKITKEPTPR